MTRETHLPYQWEIESLQKSKKKKNQMNSWFLLEVRCGGRGGGFPRISPQYLRQSLV